MSLVVRGEGHGRGHVRFGWEKSGGGAGTWTPEWLANAASEQQGVREEEPV